MNEKKLHVNCHYLCSETNWVFKSKIKSRSMHDSVLKMTETYVNAFEEILCQ